jgi:undecaprenyl-diphosphatase
MSLLVSFDKVLTSAVRDLPESYRPALRGLSLLGEPLLVLFSGFLGYTLALRAGQSAIQHAFTYAVIAFIFNTILKLVLRRKRPHGLVIETLGLRSYSFPSGHAFGTIIFYGLFSYLAFKYWAHPWDIIFCTLLATLIFSIGVSRIYLDAHYPSDVVAGWLLGSISLLVVNALAF